MHRHLIRFGLAAAVALTAGSLACGDSPAVPAPSAASSSGESSGGSGGSGGSSGSSSTGMLTIHLTDSPFSDAAALLVTFSEVSVHRADPGEWKTLPFVSGASRTCDLKRLNGATDVLGVAPLPVGKYTQIRLSVAGADLYFDNPSASLTPCAPSIAKPLGDSAPVTIPSSEIKLNNEFTLAGTGTTVTLDFDGDRSIHQTGGGNGRGNGGGNPKYMMSPVIRVLSVQ
jgi:hypothetical protein